MVSDTEFCEVSGSCASTAAVWSFAPRLATRFVVAADACFDVIVRVDTNGRVHGFVHEPLPRAHVASVDAGTRMYGVRLNPGYGAAITSKLHALVQRAEHWGRTGLKVTDFEALIGSTIADFGGPPSIIQDFIARARERAGSIRLTAERRSSKRERELQRAAKGWLGMTAKQFLRIERVQAARTAIREGRPLSEISSDLGYADQSHLTREIRELLGVTPRQLRSVGILQEIGERNP